MEIKSLQHSCAEISEILGLIPDKFIAVKSDCGSCISHFYLLFGELWVRGCLDVGVLFLDPCAHPDEDDDLEEGESYLDILDEFNLGAEEITSASMKNGVLKIQFGLSIQVLLIDTGQSTKLITERS